MKNNNSMNYGKKNYGKNIKIIGVLILAFLIFSPFFIRNPFYSDMLFQLFLFAGMATAWNLVGGFTGQISLGHTIFFGIGAYTAAILFINFHISPWINLILGGALATIVGALLGIPCFRLKGHFFALSTIALGQIFYFISLFWRDLTNGANGLLLPFEPGFKNMLFYSKLPYVYIALVFLLITLAITYLIRKSKFGFYLISIREDQEAAESLGVNSARNKLYIFMISTFFTGMGGVLYAQYITYIDPASVFSMNFSTQLGVLTILGGVGTILGPFIGSIIIVPLDIFLRGWFGQTYAGLNYLIYGLLLIVMIRNVPQGIMGWIYNKFFMTGREIEPEEACSEGASGIPSFINDAEKDQRLLTVSSLTKKFGGLVANKDVDFTISSGEVVGLIGPNGAGKTTLFSLLTGFECPTSGKVLLENDDITRLRPPYKICNQGIVRTFQLVKPFNSMTVLENVMVGAFHSHSSYKESKELAQQVIDFVGLSKNQNIQVQHLTLCDKKRVELARALATKPKILLLDEIMSGLNPTELNAYLKLLKKISNMGVTLFIIEHIMKSIMTLSDRVIVLNHGEKIAEGTPEEISENEEVITAYLGGWTHGLARSE